jgi:hypothetical protein
MVDVTRAYQVKEFVELFTICQATFWKYVAARQIKVIKIGRRTLVPGHEVDRIMHEGLTFPKKQAAA